MNDTSKVASDWKPLRENLIDGQGRYLTQSLFLEVGYNPDAVYTFKEIDHEYEGKIYPSLKRLYLETSDPTEYQFANKYLAGWDQWQRIVANKALLAHVEKWRFELEVKLRSEGVLAVRRHSQSKHPSAWQASKWLADRGWDTKGAGRPSKDDMERDKKIVEDIHRDFLEDAGRLVAIK